VQHDLRQVVRDGGSQVGQEVGCVVVEGGVKSAGGGGGGLVRRGSRGSPCRQHAGCMHGRFAWWAEAPCMHAPALHRPSPGDRLHVDSTMPTLQTHWVPLMKGAAVAASEAVAKDSTRRKAAATAKEEAVMVGGGLICSSVCGVVGLFVDCCGCVCRELGQQQVQIAGSSSLINARLTGCQSFITLWMLALLRC